MRNLVLRMLAAALVLAGGVVHLRLWNDGYKDVPDIGRAFLLNVVGSAAVAVVLVVWRHRLVPLAALGLVNGTLLAFALSRTNDGIFDFREYGWNPSPDAALALVFELAAAAVLLVLLVLERHDDSPAPTYDDHPDW